MITKLLNAGQNFEESIEKSLDHLSNSDIISFPTETVYALAADIYDPIAIEKIYRCKGRNRNNPLSALISNLEDVEKVAIDIPDIFYKLAENYFPGPLSVVLKKNPDVLDIVTGGFDTITVRFPDNYIAQEILRRYGKPLAATSANISGKPSSIVASHVADDLAGCVSVIIDGGKTRNCIESTVISLAGEVPELRRPGKISKKELSDFVGKDIRIVEKPREQITFNNYNIEKARHLSVKHFNKPDLAFSYLISNLTGKILVLADSFHFELFHKYNFSSLNHDTFYEELRYAEKKNYSEVVIVYDTENSNDEVLLDRILSLSIDR